MVQTPDFTKQLSKEKELKMIQEKKNKRPIDKRHEERAVFGKANKIRNSMCPESETPFAPRLRTHLGLNGLQTHHTHKQAQALEDIVA